MDNENIIAGSYYDIDDEIYHKQQLIREKNKKIKDRFYLKRKYSLREYSQHFLSLEIYQKFNDFFYIQTLVSFSDIEAFDGTLNIFYSNILSKKIHPIHGVSLLDFEIAKQINFLNALEQENLKKIKYFTKDEYENFTFLKLKEKIAHALVDEFISAEAIRYIVLTLQNHNLRESSFNKIVAEIEKFTDKNTNHSIYASKILYQLNQIRNMIIDQVVFFDDLSYDDTDIVLQNTMTNFEQADRIILDDTLLKDIGITTELYMEKFNSDSIQNIIDKLYDNIVTREKIKDNKKENTDGINAFIKADILNINFQIYEKDTSTFSFVIDKNRVQNMGNASLHFFTKGVLDGLALITFTEILMSFNSSKKARILKKIDAYIDGAKYSYLEHLKMIRYLVQENSHKHILLLVCIAYQLSLTRTESWKLSEILGFNNKTTFYKYFDTYYKILYPNYKYLEEISNFKKDEELKIGITF